MNRREFMKELEYLLQDIPGDDKEEALDYYRDYLEEAGDENEEQVIREFGSPERVAAIIRSDLNGNLEDGGAFTESGYQDERFREPNYQVAKRMDLPEQVSWTKSEEDCNGFDRESSGKRKRDFEDRLWLKRILKTGLILLIIGIFAPVALGIGGTAFGILTSFAALLVTGFFLVGILTVVSCLGSVAFLIMGVGTIFVQPGTGVILIGTGLFALGLGLVGIVCSFLLYGKAIPWCIRIVVDFFSGLLHKRAGGVR